MKGRHWLLKAVWGSDGANFTCREVFVWSIAISPTFPVLTIGPSFSVIATPAFPSANLREKLVRIQGILGRKGGDLTVEELLDGVFRIH